MSKGESNANCKIFWNWWLQGIIITKRKQNDGQTGHRSTTTTTTRKINKETKTNIRQEWIINKIFCIHKFPKSGFGTNERLHSVRAQISAQGGVLYGNSEHSTGNTLLLSSWTSTACTLAQILYAAHTFSAVKLNWGFCDFHFCLQHISRMIEGLWGSACGETHSAKQRFPRPQSNTCTVETAPVRDI